MSTPDWNDKAWGAQADCRAQNHSIDSRAICEKYLAAALAAAYQQGMEDERARAVDFLKYVVRPAGIAPEAGNGK